MALFHNNTENAQPPSAGKRRLSMFSFGSSTSTAQNKDSNLSTSPNSGQPKNVAAPSTASSGDAVSPKPQPPQISTTSSTTSAPQKISARSPGPYSPSVSGSKNTQLGSPVCSPLFETDSLSEAPSCNIFERSVQDLTGQVKNEDCIPPALDATAHILTDKQTNLDEVEMVYSNRRNSSVIGLNMALGRPYTPSRKNSVISMSHCNPSSNGGNAPGSLKDNYNPSNTGSQSSLTNAPPPQSPVSPPKLKSSRSSVSFYSYADMINNDEFARRPSIKHSMSHGMAPTVNRKMSVASNHSIASNPLSCNTGAACGQNSANPGSAHNMSSFSLNKSSRKLAANSTPSLPQSQLTKQIAQRDARQPTSGVPSRKSSKKGQSKLNNFMISPESSESEDHDIYYPAASNSNSPATTQRRSSIISGGSNANGDDESLVSSSIGDCIRQCTTDIVGIN
ncbi:hypothetical protein FT663_04489 [Candidozyma haemuli var. vulneris]|uniref:Uncharacterized protein n=1 Tax=Candidozyma haemuli TaxID=45357 RepID=A0A2V1AXM0_9ASCO|nr:hypothetical protein CXQ85_002574 [[Candida] haemuloni]KAF3984899.1 hypothetical protein FT662_05482 [[Candida] haemuloni var. vulneris]KAF3987337.1 hypothetical protein FT663_04489 [[Candida] haemuloni var. vulneris]PVH22850.1 hypothetical protein CXQ85_002574 [[Candida] haemuloni]